MLKRAVIFHHPESEGAAAFAGQFGRELERRQVSVLVAGAWEQAAVADIELADLVVCIGGAPHGCPSRSRCRSLV